MYVDCETLKFAIIVVGKSSIKLISTNLKNQYGSYQSMNQCKGLELLKFFFEFFSQSLK